MGCEIRWAQRLASVREPFAASNDQLAIITWFQESTPPGGYGLGAVPWCGEVAVAVARVARRGQADPLGDVRLEVVNEDVAVPGREVERRRITWDQIPGIRLECDEAAFRIDDVECGGQRSNSCDRMPPTK